MYLPHAWAASGVFGLVVATGASTSERVGYYVAPGTGTHAGRTGVRGSRGWLHRGSCLALYAPLLVGFGVIATWAL